MDVRYWCRGVGICLRLGTVRAIHIRDAVELYKNKPRCRETVVDTYGTLIDVAVLLGQCSAYDPKACNAHPSEVRLVAPHAQ